MAIDLLPVLNLVLGGSIATGHHNRPSYRCGTISYIHRENILACLCSEFKASSVKKQGKKKFQTK